MTNTPRFKIQDFINLFNQVNGIETPKRQTMQV